MYRYQNTSEVELTLVGFGVVAPGAEIVTSRVVENPNFKFMGEVQEQSGGQPIVGVAQPQPGAVTEGELLDNNKESI